MKAQQAREEQATRAAEAAKAEANRARAALQMKLRQDAVDKAKQTVTSGRVPYNSCMVVLVGPGNAGKTSLRRGLQGIAFQEERESTLGGEVHNMTVELEKQDLVGFNNATIRYDAA